MVVLVAAKNKKDPIKNIIVLEIQPVKIQNEGARVLTILIINGN